MATLVMGPMAMIVTCPGRAFTVSTMNWAAEIASAFRFAKPPGGGEGGASDHHSPWRVVANSLFSCSSGMLAPA